MTFDDELRRTLQRATPPHGFADRVRSRIAPPQATVAPPARRLGVPLALAASLAAVILSSSAWLAHEQRLEREHARAQLLLALRVTSHELRQIQQRLDTR